MKPSLQWAAPGIILLAGTLVAVVLSLQSVDGQKTSSPSSNESSWNGRLPHSASPIRKHLPPVGEPLASTFGPLNSMAEKGDARAAKRLFQDTSECLQVAQLKSVLLRLSKQKQWILNNPKIVRHWERTGSGELGHDLDVIQGELDRIDRAKQLCSGMKTDMDDGRIYQIALEAARLGDSNATACLLMAPYKPPKFSAREGKAYVEEVLALARQGIRGGNWRVAMAMTFVHGGQFRGSGYAGLLVNYNLLKELEFSELLRLGTPDGSPDAAHLDRRLSLLEGTVPRRDQIEARRWANTTYNEYYFYSGPVFPDALPCPD